MSYNIYSSPEKFGMTVVGELDIAESYEFCTLVVWQRDSDGAMFYDIDSGCSCPIPFEDAGVDTLTPITDGATFAAEARKWYRESYYSTDPGDRDALESLIRKVRRKVAKP